MDYSNMEARVILPKIRQGELRVSEYIDILLKRCEQYEELNAFIYLDPDKVRDVAVENYKYPSTYIIKKIYGHLKKTENKSFLNATSISIFKAV